MQLLKSHSFNGKCFFVAWLLLFFLLYLVGESFLPEKYFRDSELLLEIASGSAEASLDGSYYYTTLIFTALGDSLLQVLLVGIAIVYLYLFSSHLNTVTSMITGSLLIMPHVVMGMSRPQKELIVSCLAVVVYYFCYKYKSSNAKVFFYVVACYLTYSVVRNYYAIILIAMFYLLIFYKAKEVYQKIALVFLLVLAVSLPPNEIYDMIQGTKDMFNALRPQGEGHETVYFNPFPPVDAINFILNYLHAIVYFNLPVFFHLSVNSLYLQLYIIVLVYLYFFRPKLDDGERILALFFIGHALTLLLFEPDLGSYLRHLSSVALYLAPLIGKRSL